jgi:hypothetical protein
MIDIEYEFKSRSDAQGLARHTYIHTDRKTNDILNLKVEFLENNSEGYNCPCAVHGGVDV